MKKIFIISPLFKDWFPVPRILRRLGYAVCIKRCSKSALITLNSMSFDLILVGEELDDMTGLDLISKIYCPRTRKKIVLLSNQDNLKGKKRSQLIANDQYIHLSISWVDFATLVNWSIGGRNDLCLN